MIWAVLVDSLWIPSQKVDSLHYICRIPSQKVDSSLLIKCLPPYIGKWMDISFLSEEHNRHNRLA